MDQTGNMPGDILGEAKKLVEGARQDQHGDYFELHKRVARVFTAMLGDKLDKPLVASDVAAFMVALKMERSKTGGFNPDDGLDMTGYSAIFAACTAREAENTGFTYHATVVTGEVDLGLDP